MFASARNPVASAAVSTALISALGACTPGPDASQPVEQPAAPAEPPDPYQHSRSRYGAVPLHAGFSPDPRTVSGEALGEIEARSIHRKCRGFVSKTPDYLLQSDTAFYQLYVLGRSRSDVVLIVRKPDGSVVCNDNRRGTSDPMIKSSFPIGTTQIWVGVKEEGARAPYRLGFSEVKWKSSSIPLPEDG